MDFERLRHTVEVVAETSARVAGAIDGLADKAYDFIEYAEDFWVAAQPPVEDGPVEEEPDLQTIIDYLWLHTGAYSKYTRMAFTKIMSAAPDVTRAAYEAEQALHPGR